MRSYVLTGLLVLVVCCVVESRVALQYGRDRSRRNLGTMPIPGTHDTGFNGGSPFGMSNPGPSPRMNMPVQPSFHNALGPMPAHSNGGLPGMDGDVEPRSPVFG
ncbi:uncharacterized protein LOC144100085 [Amblyomma americanum]